MTTPDQSQELTPLQKKVVSRKLMEAEITSRAWTDDTFRAKLETDPVAALTEAGLPVPENKAIRVTQEAPDTLTLVIPPPPTKAEEVNDGELEAVAGGGAFDGGVCREAQEMKQLNRRHGWKAHEEQELKAAKFKFEWFFGKSWAWG